MGGDGELRRSSRCVEAPSRYGVHVYGDDFEGELKKPRQKPLPQRISSLRSTSNTSKPGRSPKSPRSENNQWSPDSKYRSATSSGQDSDVVSSSPLRKSYSASMQRSSSETSLNHQGRAAHSEGLLHLLLQACDAVEGNAASGGAEDMETRQTGGRGGPAEQRPTHQEALAGPRGGSELSAWWPQDGGGDDLDGMIIDQVDVNSLCGSGRSEAATATKSDAGRAGSAPRAIASASLPPLHRTYSAGTPSDASGMSPLSRMSPLNPAWQPSPTTTCSGQTHPQDSLGGLTSDGESSFASSTHSAKRRREPSPTPAATADSPARAVPARRFVRYRTRDMTGPCAHCGVTESPQWRKGPKNKPVLCNACGTRYLRTRALGKASVAKKEHRSAALRKAAVAGVALRAGAKSTATEEPADAVAAVRAAGPSSFSTQPNPAQVGAAEAPRQAASLAKDSQLVDTFHSICLAD